MTEYQEASCSRGRIQQLTGTNVSRCLLQTSLQLFSKIIIKSSKFRIVTNPPIYSKSLGYNVRSEQEIKKYI